MNQRAIDDLLGTTLSQWYATAATWSAPGELSGRTCASCQHGATAHVVDPLAWPHDLIHRLNGQIEALVVQIGVSLAEDPRDLDAERAMARELTLGALVAHAHDLTDVLAECVAPRLEAFVAVELDRALREFDRLPDSH